MIRGGSLFCLAFEFLRPTKKHDAIPFFFSRQNAGACSSPIQAPITTLASFLFLYLSLGVCQGPPSGGFLGQGTLVQKEGHCCPETLSATFRTEEEELAK